jgi:hypothetical protein
LRSRRRDGNEREGGSSQQVANKTVHGVSLEWPRDAEAVASIRGGERALNGAFALFRS